MARVLEVVGLGILANLLTPLTNRVALLAWVCLQASLRVFARAAVVSLLILSTPVSQFVTAVATPYAAGALYKPDVPPGGPGG